MVRKCNRSAQLTILAAAFAGLGAHSALATPLVFEDFNPAANPAPVDLAGTPAAGGGAVAGEFGLTGNWINNSAAYSNANGTQLINRTITSGANGTPLVYPTNSSLPAPAGGSAQNPGGYANNLYAANLTTPIPLSGSSSTYYFSYLLENGNQTDFAAQLVFSAPSTQIYAGFGYGSRDDVSVEPTGALPFGTGNSYNASGGSFGQGFTGGNLGLVVGELVTAPSGVDTVNVKLFRYTAGGPSAALPTSASNLTWDTSYNTPAESDTVTQLGIFLTGNTSPEMDAIRVGTTYADVVGTVSAVALSGTFTTYTGKVNGNFDTSTQNFSFNGSSVAFANGNNVLFDDTATGTHNIVVAAGGVSPSAVTFNATSGYNFSGGAITSPGMLNLAGSGTVTLANANTYSGGANLSNGTVLLAAGGTLTVPSFSVGTGVLNFNGGTLQASNSSTGFITGTPINVLAGGATIDTQAFNISIGDSLSASASSTGGGLTKIGSGNLTLAGNSTYTGGTIVNAGTLTLASGGGGGDVLDALTINSGATVNATATDALGYSAGNAVTTLTVNSGGTFILGAGNEGYITNLVLAGGTVSATAGGSFNFNTGYNISSSASTTTGTISSDIAIRGSSLNITVASGTTASGIDLNITGRLLGPGSAVLNIFGPGTLSLGGSGTFGAGTNINGATVIAANPAAFGPVVDNVGVSLTAGTLVLGALSAPSGPFVLPESVTYTNGGKLQLAPTPNYSSGTVAGGISISDGSTVSLTIGTGQAAGVTHGLLTTTAITFGSSTAGSFDVGKNDLDITTQSVATITPMIASAYNNGAWTGPGISSSAAAVNSTHLTALGVIRNDNGSGTPLYGTGGTIASTFDGATPADGETLVKYTYYGDANLDGKIDGSDYSRIDAAFLANRSTPGSATGWYNGDFNYDGVIDGSDYTLIDNAFNRQGAQIAALVATSTAQIASSVGSSSVPEPTMIGLLAIGAAGLLSRRRRI